MFLLLESNVEMNEILPCKIKNAFHTSEFGCYLIKTDSGIFHVYKKQQYRQTLQGEYMYDVLGLDWIYKVQPYFDATGGRVYTKFPIGFVGIEEFLDTKANFLVVYKNLLNDYHTVWRPMLVTSEGVQYDFAVGQLYDTAGMNFTLHRLRPLSISNDKGLFIREQRKAFFELLQIYAEKRDLVADPNVTRLREGRICSASTFCKRGKIPPEFECAYYHRDRCVHLQENMIFGKLELIKPEKTCHFVLAALIEEYGEFKVNELYGFNCCFIDINDEPERSMTTTFTHLFDRTPHLHRLCLPDEFLSTKWYKWFLTKFFDLGHIDI